MAIRVFTCVLIGWWTFSKGFQMDSWKPMGSWNKWQQAWVLMDVFLPPHALGSKLPLVPCKVSYTHSKDSLFEGDDHPQYKEFRPWTIWLENLPKMANWLAGQNGFHKMPFFRGQFRFVKDVCVFATWAAFQNPCIFRVRYKYLYFARLGKGSFQRILGYLGSKPPQPRKYV